MARVGFATGYDPEMSIRDMVPAVQSAEQLGYELAFFSETLSLMRDSVSAAAVLGAQTNRIAIGFTQIVRLRSPVVMAQTLLTLNELTGGRVILAPGACTRAHAARHGLEPLDPPGTLEEWVEALRAFMTSQTVSLSGQYFKLKEVSFGWAPTHRTFPLWVAATSRTGLKLAGRIGDGVLLNAMSSPQYTANAVAILREEVERSGRDWDTFEVAQLINCSVEDSLHDALEKVRWEVASKFTPWQLPFNAGPRIRVGEPHIEQALLPGLQEAFDSGGMTGLSSAIPEQWIEGLTASGTPAMAREKVDAYRRAGVRLPILRPAALDQVQRVLETFAPGS